MQNNKLVTFIFQSGRKERLEGNKKFAKEMFYTYFNFDKEFRTSIIEFGSWKDKKFNWFVFYFEREFVRRFFKIPFYPIYLTNKKNYNKLVNSDLVVMSSHRIASSVLPMTIFLKIFRKKTKTIFFVMGLFSSYPKYKLLKLVQSFFYLVLIYFSDNFFFIVEGEYKYAYKKYKYLNKKFSYIPFGIDFAFWKQKELIESSKKEGILFVGNDSNRDFDLLIDIAARLPDIKFTFVTSQIKQEILPSNVNLISGSWGEPKLTDEELKEMYLKHKLTIIPLKESLQPSGQSVALQSMAVGTPVVLSKTSGIWDTKSLINEENIILVDKNIVDIWINIIDKLYKDDNKLNNLSKNSVETIKLEFNLDDFYKEVKKISGIEL